MITSNYIGRFAPTPSGPLHFGSLVAALGSYVDAKAHGGRWLLRIENVDRNRSQMQAIDMIYRQLEGLHLYWDGEVRIQSKHLADYEQGLKHLKTHLYPCYCSRKQWHRQARDGALGKVYPGICEGQPLTSLSPVDAAIRLKMPECMICFDDRLLGEQCYFPKTDIGDPVLKRRDHDIAYALAVVIDDALQGITHIVRGQDLLATTVIQRYLQQLLQLPSIHYLHLPLIVDTNGAKLSKQNHAPAIQLTQANRLIYQALQCLGQPVDQSMLITPIDEVLEVAIQHWRIGSIPTQSQLLTEHEY